MEFSFECRCGEETVGITRGMDEATSRSRIQCRSCDAVYAVTVTSIVTDSPPELTTR